MDGFREKIIGLGGKSAEIMDEYFNGKRQGTDMVKEASKMISQAIKVEHINQIKTQTDRSFSLRLLQFLPKSGPAREKYISLTNPELRPLLLDKPKK